MKRLRVVVDVTFNYAVAYAIAKVHALLVDIICDGKVLVGLTVVDVQELDSSRNGDVAAGTGQESAASPNLGPRSSVSHPAGTPTINSKLKGAS